MNAPMIALHTKRRPAMTAMSWLMQQNPDEAAIQRRERFPFRYGSFRPSDRAALLIDATPVLTPYADEPLALEAD